MDNKENSVNVNSPMDLQNQNANAEMRDKINAYNNNINSNAHNSADAYSRNSNIGGYNSSSINDYDRQSGDQKKDEKARNDANNAEAVRTAADVASKSGHPVAAAIGNGVKAADKLTGGKASEKLGKATSRINKLAPGGRLGQAFTNKSVESGMADKIRKANSKRNGSSASGVMTGNSQQPNLKNQSSTGSDLNDSSRQKREMEDSYDDGKENFKVSLSTIIKIAVAAVPAFFVIVFMVLLISGSQVFLQATTLGQADTTSDSDAKDKIDSLVKDNPEKLDTEVDETEDNSENNSGNRSGDDVSYVGDIYVDYADPIENYEFVDEKEKNTSKEYDKVSLDDLEDFYPDIVNYTTDEYNQNDVYKFFTKLYYINKYYATIGVHLDLPLIMSTLRLQSDDMSIVFKANTAEYTKSDIEKGENNDDFKVDKDWSGYKSTKINSAHDIEVLAQGMAKPGGAASGKDGNYVGDVEFMTGGVGKIYYFNQLDYPNSPYGSYGTIASHGCGPTALSIAISSLLEEVHDPIELTNYVCSIGGCTNAGSTWQSITDTPPHYGLKATQTTNTQQVISSLGTGKAIVIVIMCPGHFTSGGHFITLTATKENGMVTVADPASRDRSKDWEFNTVAEETCGSYWIVTK